MNNHRTRGNVISHIERSRDRQASRLCKSLGSILNGNVNPPCKILDVMNYYRETQMSFENAHQKLSSSDDLL